MIYKLAIALTLLYIPCFAEYISFHEAWNILTNRSKTLKVKEEDVNIAKFQQKKAKDLNYPDITLSAIYTHLSDEIGLNGNELDLQVDESSIKNIVENLAKGVYKNAYDENFKSTSSVAEATKAAKKASGQFVQSFSKIKNDLQNSSFDLSKDDIFYSTINLTYPLFTGGKIKALQAISSQKVHEARELLALSRQKEFENLVAIYFMAVLSKEIKKSKDDVVHSLLKHYENSKKLFLQGQIAKIESLSAKARLDKAKVDAIKAQREEEVANLALQSLLFKDVFLKTNSKLFINEHLPSLEDFIQKSLLASSALNVLRSKKYQADHLIQAKKGDFFPNLFLFGSYTLYKDESPLFKSAPQWLAGIGLDYKLFDSKGRGEELNIAYSKKMQTELLHEDLKREIKVLVEKTYKEALLEIEEFKGLKSSIELALENLTLRKKSFLQGLGTSLDVIDAELFLQSVKIQRLVASYKYILSLSKLLSLSNQIEYFFIYEEKP